MVETVLDIVCCLLKASPLIPFGQSLDLSRYLLGADGFISEKLRLVPDIGVGM